MTVLDDKLQVAIERLKKSGVRITPQRHAVLEYLLTSMSHPTADEIYTALEEKCPNMRVATVYNNWRIIREIGLIKELRCGNYSRRFDSNMNDHYHIICEDCGKIVDFHYPTLDEIESLAERVSGFDRSHHQMQLNGKCEQCADVKVQEHKII